MVPLTNSINKRNHYKQIVSQLQKSKVRASLQHILNQLSRPIKLIKGLPKSLQNV
jgi:hypothetical protein